MYYFSVIFRNKESHELVEFENVVYVSNRDGAFMIQESGKSIPEFIDNVKFELWRIS